jgi:ferredoxin
VELARGWLKSCEQDLEPVGSLIIQEVESDPAKARQRPVISAERPLLNRRKFLFGFARSSGSASLALTHLPTEAGDEGLAYKTAPHLPAWLRRLAAIYPNTQANVSGRGGAGSNERAGQIEPQTGLNPSLSGEADVTDQVDNTHWPALKVADNCAACRACALNCPSGALSTEVGEGVYRHMFTPGLCVACGLCARVCPTGALSRSYTIDPQPFVKRGVAERPVEACRKCGAPALRRATSLCFCCAAEPSLNSLLENARSHLLHP